MTASPASGPVALVTGAAQGIGQAVAERLAQQGATVACLDRQPRQLARTVSQLRAAGLRASAHAVELTDRAAVRDVVAEIEARCGAVTQLACVAGIFREAPALELTQAQLNELLQVNLFGVLHVVQAVLPAMLEHRSGSIVTVGSNAGRTPRVGMAAYGASKAAAAALTLSMGIELARFGIRCNVVSPGSTATAMQRALWTSPDAERRVIRGELSKSRLGIALGRIAAPLDVAEVVVFLLSERARHVTLQNVTVDGGATF